MKNHDPNIETIDKSRHGKLRIKSNVGQSHAKEQNLAGVVLSELNACTSNFPVVFIDMPEINAIRPVAMLGLRPGENAYYNESGWDATYVPLMVQRYPFVIGFDDRVEDPQQLAPCLVRNSPLVSETDGIALFKDNGEETDFLNNRQMVLREIFDGERIVDDFMQRVRKLDLLTPLEVVVQPLEGEVRRVTGMYTLDQQKLKGLSKELSQELLDLEFLPACYLILGSMFQIHRLMQLRNTKKLEAVVDYRIDVGVPPPPAAAN